MLEPGNRSGWALAIVLSGLLNITLFGIMPGMIQKLPEKPDLLEKIQAINVIHLDKPILPPDKPDPPLENSETHFNNEQPVHKPLENSLATRPKIRVYKPKQPKPELSFELNPKLPIPEITLDMPPPDIPDRDVSTRDISPQEKEIPEKQIPEKQLMEKPPLEILPPETQIVETQIAEKQISDKQMPETQTLAKQAREKFSLPTPRVHYHAKELDLPLTALVKPSPVYPLKASRRGIQGWVKVQFIVNTSGLVEDVEIIQSNPSKVFDKNVIKCVAQWKFKPGTVEGALVSTLVKTTIKFQLE